MKYVAIELKNIKWPVPGMEEDIPPLELLIEVCLWDSDVQSTESIDHAIADHLESQYGFRPLSWDLWVFEPEAESADETDDSVEYYAHV